jgi:chorismate mutase/prephenate dehydratase
MSQEKSNKTKPGKKEPAQDAQAEQLDLLRGKIDAVDMQMLELLNQRAGFAMDVAEVKKQHAVDMPPVFYRPEREAQVLRNLMEKNPGPLSDDKITLLFRQIMAACLALEQPLTIAYLGPPGTFTQMAAFKQFGEGINDKSMPTVDDVFRDVEAETSNYGVVPVENSTEGVINHTLDNFLDSTLKVCGEVELRVHHNLMIAAAADEASVTRIYSHQQTLAQCRRWLDGHWSRVPRIAVTSNAEAALKVTQESGAAAIASDMAAELYGLKIISNKIEDKSDNTTRFLIIGREHIGQSGNDKTSIMVSTRNRPGALYHILEPFHRHSISLTSIETRPSSTGMWSYVFFIDFEGHQADESFQQVLKEINEDALEVKILGSYPRAVT